ncbi:hypothetical protein [Paenilisteria rocourtiae]|uniref:Phage Mu protein F like protein n=1 Tax=Listeria rocourtiae TaxID=647910 RepID=A0A4V3DQ73_9LIST|nr:hypothetical protein [Listeria rocourtiae]EUJ44404.1 Phage protein [Listeria rocourtiae FSL F6-920]TDR55116.1 hypothetical protein DFP96_10144 [Listeria rocourtiae]
MNQREVNEFFEDLAAQFVILDEKQQRRFTKSVDNIRLEVLDVLETYADENSVIPASRRAQVLRAFDTIEQQLYATMSVVLQAILVETATWTIEKVNKYLARNMDAEAQADLVQAVVKNVVSRREPADELQLSDRLYRLSGDLTDDFRKTVRLSISRKQTINKTGREIKAAVDSREWHYKQLSGSESPVTYRKAIGEIAKKSEQVKAVRLHAGVKRSRICLGLSKENRHGLGAGVFLPEKDDDIYSPHPKCTSFLTYELTNEEGDL